MRDNPHPAIPSIGVGLAEYPEGGGGRMWPKTLYLTPPEWGEESHVLVEEEVQDVVRDLRDLGEEWKGISPDDLVRMEFVREVAPGRAVYEVAGQRVVVTPYRGGVLMDRYTLAGVDSES
jgi:hypothetical protein